MAVSLPHLAPILLRAWLRPSSSLVGRLKQRVRPSWVDMNLHMNQAAYPEVMELGRADWMLRTGAWKRWRSEGFNPMVGEQTVIYRRELKPLQRFTVDTRLVGIDGRLAVMESHLLVADRVHSKGTAKLLLVGPNGVGSADEVEELLKGLIALKLRVKDWTVA